MAFDPERLGAALDACLSGVDPAAGLCVALSGGLDSTVLLAALAARRGAGGSRAIRAIHVDHGLHADSRHWAMKCARQCALLGVGLEELVVDARPPPGESPEAAARAARYAALAGRLSEGEVLVTAHHADDQIETVLLQWLRGGGLRSVAGMPACQRFGRGWHARPLLGFTRGELLAWAGATGLEWLEDPSNDDPRFDRNYLRLEVLPAIRRRWPAAARTVGRVALQAAEALEVGDLVAAADLAEVRDGEALALDRLQRLPDPRRRPALRAWLDARGLPTPSSATLAALLHDALRAAPDRVPCVDWPGARVYRYRDRLFAVAGRERSPLPAGRWSPAAAFDLGAHGRLELRPGVGRGLSRARCPGELEVSVREPGDRFRPAGSAHHRPLRKWLQEHDVLPWRRDDLPLLRSGGEIVAIADLACGGGLEATADEPSWIVQWTGRPAITVAEAVGQTGRD